MHICICLNLILDGSEIIINLKHDIDINGIVYFLFIRLIIFKLI